jgi:hypothetical protein
MRAFHAKTPTAYKQLMALNLPDGAQHIRVGCRCGMAELRHFLESGAPGMKAMGTQIIGKFMFPVTFEGSERTPRPVRRVSFS